MKYCIYNAIRTPDGTLLWCQHSHDYQVHKDTVSGETYMNDGLGYYTRRSANKTDYEDLSVWVDVDNPELTDEVRSIALWGTRGIDGDQPMRKISLKQMQDDHLCAILQTQRHIKGSVIEKLLLLELEHRNLTLG